MNVAGRSVVVALVGTLLWAACGSDDSGGDDRAALCKQGCAKVESLCFPDAGGTFLCSCPLAPDDGGTTCTNQSEINTVFKACLEKTTCQEFLTCKIPKCVRPDAGG